MRLANRNTPTILATLCVVSLLVTSVAVAQLIPTIAPGGMHDFRADGALHVLADDIESETSFLPVIALAVANENSVPLSSFVWATSYFGRAKATILQSNDFLIQPGNYGETVLQGQFGGTVNIGGFIALVGLGTAKMDVKIRVIDITDPDRTRVVAVQALNLYEISNSLEIGTDLSVGAQLGSITVGQAGIDLGMGFAIPFERKIVRDSVDFGFTALLRRGHSYRFQVIAESRAELGATGGTGIVSFFNALAPIPNEVADPVLLAIPPQILDTEWWIDKLDWPLLNEELPALELPASGSRFSIPNRVIQVPSPTGPIPIPLPGFSPSISPIYPPPFQNVDDTNDVLNILGYNTNLKDILVTNIDRVLPADPIQFRGIELQDLTIDIANDDSADIKELLLNPKPSWSGKANNN